MESENLPTGVSSECGELAAGRVVPVSNATMIV
jgi:hypothetical protein